ncbi:MAG: hypothetical protein KDB90_14480 [Planctomycetes bacterium]|nr:hypothetical protein [Planctomycetota bacterium]
MLTAAQLLARALIQADGLALQDTSDVAEQNHRELRTTLTALALPGSNLARAGRAVKLMLEGELTEAEKLELAGLGESARKLAQQALPSYRRMARNAEIAELRATVKAPAFKDLVTEPEVAELQRQLTKGGPTGEVLTGLRQRIGSAAYELASTAVTKHQRAQERIAALEEANESDPEPHEALQRHAAAFNASITEAAGKHADLVKKQAEAEAIRKARAEEERKLAEAEEASRTLATRSQAEIDAELASELAAQARRDN